MRVSRRPLSNAEQQSLAQLRKTKDRTPSQQQRFEQLSAREERYGHECPPILRDILRF